MSRAPRTVRPQPAATAERQPAGASRSIDHSPIGRRLTTIAEQLRSGPAAIQHVDALSAACGPAWTNQTVAKPVALADSMSPPRSAAVRRQGGVAQLAPGDDDDNKSKVMGAAGAATAATIGAKAYFAGTRSMMDNAVKPAAKFAGGTAASAMGPIVEGGFGAWSLADSAKGFMKGGAGSVLHAASLSARATKFAPLVLGAGLMAKKGYDYFNPPKEQ